jgi:hypothetical protein
MDWRNGGRGVSDEMVGYEAFCSIGYIELVRWACRLNNAVWVFKIVIEDGIAGSVRELAMCDSTDSKDGVEFPELGVLEGLSLRKRE